MGAENDYLFVLKGLSEIPFNVGKTLLIEFLQGKEKNNSVNKHKLFKLDNFGCLAYSQNELSQIIDSLILNNFIRKKGLPHNKFMKILEVTEKGLNEILDPQFHKNKLCNNYIYEDSKVTKEDKEIFKSFGDFLEKYNDEQKKSIVSSKEKVLCIAGAGSGKTTVLTKRIEYLVKYKSVNPEKILAITFTKKARKEMISRLNKIHGMNSVSIETFNSFCEKILRNNSFEVYGKEVRVINYRDKFKILLQALRSVNLDLKRAINMYFTYVQRQGKTEELLSNIFLSDCFFIRDYFKFKNKKITRSEFENVEIKHESTVALIIKIVDYINIFMVENGLRDFADQLLDTIDFFTKNPSKIPLFDHVLVDEYQDVNSTQIKFMDILGSKNIFGVGDPRQSIYGWRGSDIRYILNFNEKYKDAEIISLKTNYRSSKTIVDLVNLSIKRMKLPDLEPFNQEKSDLRLLHFDTEDAEFEFVIQSILNSDLNRNDIFVLARTNRQLNRLSEIMKAREISYVLRSDEVRKTVEVSEGQITLATVHAIKGLEAEMVFLIGCTANNYPCRGSDHPIIDMIKVDEYDKEEEERRLFYVAMSRAKSKLFLTYAGKNHTYFITDEMLSLLQEKPKVKFNIQDKGDVVSRLKEWRSDKAATLKVPPYMILNDRTIIDLGIKQPSNITELNDIFGLGPTKIMKYGEEILDLLFWKIFENIY